MSGTKTRNAASPRGYVIRTVTRNCKQGHSIDLSFMPLFITHDNVRTWLQKLYLIQRHIIIKETTIMVQLVTVSKMLVIIIISIHCSLS